MTATIDLDTIWNPPSAAAVEQDLESATSAAILTKLAAEAGVDLAKLSPTELQGFADQLHGRSSPSSTERPKESAMTTENLTPEQEAAQIAEFDAFVTQETIKAAAANDIDLSALSPSDLAILKSNMEAIISEDVEGYLAEMNAAEEGAKLAAAQAEEADVTGRLMARSFFDEFQKLSGAEPDDEGGGEKVASRFAALKGKAGEMAGKAKSKFNDFSTRVGRGVEKHTGIGEKGTKEVLDRATAARKAGLSEEHTISSAVDALKDRYARLGRRAMGAGAATAAAGAAGAAASRKKEAADEFEAQAYAVARAALIANGIDPDGVVDMPKIAEAELSPELQARAAELLKAAGFEV